MKPILLLDFDGVCHSFISGWCGPAIIPDPPVEGLYEFLEEAGQVFEIHIWSTRNSYPEGIRAMQAWLKANANGQDLPEIHFPTEKPPAHIAIDDRALTFTGTWPAVQELRNFVPWNRSVVSRAEKERLVRRPLRNYGPFFWDGPYFWAGFSIVLTILLIAGAL